MENKVFYTFLIFAGCILFFICACEDSPSSRQIPPEELIELIGKGADDDDGKIRGSGYNRRRSGSSSTGGSSGDVTPTIEVPVEPVPIDISQLNQISGLMAQGKYDRASALSKGTFPQLSELIEDGNYQEASLLLSRMLVYLSR